MWLLNLELSWFRLSYSDDKINQTVTLSLKKTAKSQIARTHNKVNSDNFWQGNWPSPQRSTLDFQQVGECYPVFLGFSVKKAEGSPNETSFTAKHENVFSPCSLLPVNDTDLTPYW